MTKNPGNGLRRKAPRTTGLAVATALAMAMSLLSCASSNSSSSGAAEPTWSDEFGGAAGGAVDTSKWIHEVNGEGGGNAESQYYTGGTRNAALDGRGHLVITARRGNPDGYECHYGRCRYTSARINTSTKFTQRYGRFEARIRVPRGRGMWPAFWMLGCGDDSAAAWPDCGEIDVMENIGHEPGTVHGSLHGPGYSDDHSLTGAYELPNGRAFADGFHTFAVDWKPGRITWSVDGHEYQRRTPADAKGRRWVFDHGFFLILNLAVGGSWPGPPDEDTEFPQAMAVDYVRVYA